MYIADLSCTVRTTGWHLSSVQMRIWSISFVGRWSFGDQVLQHTHTQTETKYKATSISNYFKTGGHTNPNILTSSYTPQVTNFTWNLKVMVSKIGISHSRGPVSGELFGKVMRGKRCGHPPIFPPMAKMPKAKRKPCPTKRPRQCANEGP